MTTTAEPVDFRLILAPLEGCMDWSVRELLSDIGGLDYCVTEFIRVSDQLLPPKSFYRLCPELHQQGTTASGAPVRVQLLGSEPQVLQENAQRALELGSYGIDLNLGCPSKIVNGHGGGARMLLDLEQTYHCIAAMAAVTPPNQTFTVKVRLGFYEADEILDIIACINAAGAHEVVIHGRTRQDGYRAHTIKWDWIAKAREASQIPVIANGEVWSRDDWQACRHATGCRDIMLGRGAMAQPNLFRQIKYGDAPYSWQDICRLLLRYSDYDTEGRWFHGRCKQWLGFLKTSYPDQAQQLFQQIRQLKKKADVVAVLQRTADVA